MSGAPSRSGTTPRNRRRARRGVLVYCCLEAAADADLQPPAEPPDPILSDSDCIDSDCIDFGRIVLPTGAHSVCQRLDPASASAPTSDQAPALVSVTVKARGPFTLTAAPPVRMVRSDGCSSIDYGLLWAQRVGPNGAFRAVAGKRFAGAGGGATHTFLFGGSVYGIHAATAPGIYTARMVITVMCM